MSRISRRASLEKETMRLQEALKDRDDEIRALETSLRGKRQSAEGTVAADAERADEEGQTLLAPAHATVNGVGEIGRAHV